MIGRLFHQEEINGDGACPTYLYRWTLLRLGGWLAVYLHHFVGDDWSTDLHDHPKRFISIGLWGSYLEWSPLGESGFIAGTEYRAPWLRSFPATHIHRLTLHRNPDGSRQHCWTLVIVGRKVREWGFWHAVAQGRREHEWRPWHSYVADHELVARVKSCP